MGKLVLDSKGISLKFKGVVIAYLHFKMIMRDDGFPMLFTEVKFRGKKYGYKGIAKIERLRKFFDEAVKLYNPDRYLQGDQSIKYNIGKRKFRELYYENRVKKKVR